MELTPLHELDLYFFGKELELQLVLEPLPSRGAQKEGVARVKLRSLGSIHEAL